MRLSSADASPTYRGTHNAARAAPSGVYVSPSPTSDSSSASSVEASADTTKDWPGYVAQTWFWSNALTDASRAQSTSSYGTAHDSWEHRRRRK